MAILAPSSRKAHAQASPIPLLPPVIRTARFFKPSSIFVSLWVNTRCRCKNTGGVRKRLCRSNRLREKEAGKDAGEDRHTDPVVMPKRTKTAGGIAIADHPVLDCNQARRDSQTEVEKPAWQQPADP